MGLWGSPLPYVHLPHLEETAHPSQAQWAKTASGADVAGTGLHRQPPHPIPELKVDLTPMDGRNKAAAAPLPAKISIWKASLQLGPSPSPGVMLRKLGPVSDTSPCAVPPAKT